MANDDTTTNRDPTTDASATCLANIGPKGRRRRMTMGVVTFAIAGVAATVLIALDLSVWWRLVLIVPLWLAALGVFQARAHT